jgi:carbamoyltransferase
MNVLGISAFYHDAACCLLRDGRLVAAAQEERFSRLKHDPRLPVSAFRFCLEKGGMGPADLDAVAYYESPVKKLARQLWAGGPAGRGRGARDRSPDLAWLDPARPERAIRERLGWDGPLLTFDHHQSHAASAFFFSGFPRAAVLTVDGVGEWATTTYGVGEGAALEAFAEVEFPHSLGLLYSTLTAYLGFAVNDGEYKVMGLAPYGAPRYVDRLQQLLQPGPEGRFTLDMRYFDFVGGPRMFSDALCALLGEPPRRPGAKITPFHRDVASSLQRVLEEFLLEKVRWLHGRTGAADLCMAGGVALNCVANGRIRREGPFSRLFVPPAPGDAGGCLGAAALAHAALTGVAPGGGSLAHAFLGPSFTGDEVAAILASTGLPACDFRGAEQALLAAVAERLACGQVIAWFHGPLELGPRALGARSLLADPRHPGIRERLNRLVKRREDFRPFAPSVLLSHAAEHFELDHPSPFMLEICRVRSPLDLAAVTHVDGSARPQTVDPATAPRFAGLLEAFRGRTGCPVLLNTSFNRSGEPIVGSPADALAAMAEPGIDALVLEDFVLDGRDVPANWRDLMAAWRQPRRALAGGRLDPETTLREDLYTFA